VVGDPAGLRLALGNLLGNALRHGGAPPWAAVRARHDLERGEVRIAVSDRGPGVPEGDRERLFEPFFRGANAREGQVAGAGLGLHLAGRAAAEHDGRIEIESAPGQGSTFTLVLPAGGAAA
jgi:two-component system sensor histidine kinase SenX3